MTEREHESSAHQYAAAILGLEPMSDARQTHSEEISWWRAFWDALAGRAGSVSDSSRLGAPASRDAVLPPALREAFKMLLISRPTDLLRDERLVFQARVQEFLRSARNSPDDLTELADAGDLIAAIALVYQLQRTGNLRAIRRRAKAGDRFARLWTIEFDQTADRMDSAPQVPSEASAFFDEVWARALARAVEP